MIPCSFERRTRPQPKPLCRACHLFTGADLEGPQRSRTSDSPDTRKSGCISVPTGMSWPAYRQMLIAMRMNMALPIAAALLAFSAGSGQVDASGSVIALPGSQPGDDRAIHGPVGHPRAAELGDAGDRKRFRSIETSFKSGRRSYPPGARIGSGQSTGGLTPAPGLDRSSIRRVERPDDFRDPRHFARPRQLESSFQGGHSVMHDGKHSTEFRRHGPDLPIRASEPRRSRSTHRELNRVASSRPCICLSGDQ